MAKEPQTVEAYFAEVERASGDAARLDTAVREIKTSLGDLDTIELRARRIVERMALTLQASLRCPTITRPTTTTPSKIRRGRRSPLIRSAHPRGGGHSARDRHGDRPSARGSVQRSGPSR